MRAGLRRASGGVLFIDEAYTLVRGGENDFGREAIDQIVKLIEDRRDRVVLVAAGYPAEMEDFLSANPGLRSRLPNVIEFPDYESARECYRSPEYGRAMAIRKTASTGDILIVEGYDGPQPGEN